MSSALTDGQGAATRGLAFLVLALLATVLSWAILFAAVPPLAQDFPLGDDWAFNLGAFLFAEGAGIHYSQWASMPQLGQWLWASPFIWIYGRSFLALRLSTILLSMMGLAAFYDLLRQDGRLSPRQAALATATLALNPLFLLLQGTFMTDVPSLSLALIALALYTRALASGRLLTIMAACAVAVVGAITRQNTVAVPVVAGILLWRSPWLRWPDMWPWLLAIPVPIATGLATHWWFQRHGDILNMPLLQSPPGLALSPYLLIHICGLSVLPFIALDPRPHSWKRFGIALAILLACAAYWSNFWWAYGFILPYGGLFPYCTGMMGPYGAFAGKLVAGEREVLLTTNLRLFLSLLGCVAGAWLVDRTLARVRTDRLPGSILLFTLLQIGLLLLVRSLYDRYLLFFLPGALYLASSERDERRLRWLPGLAMLLVLGAVSIGLMHDWLAWNAARWAIGRRAVEQGISAHDIEGGFEWNGWHAPRPRLMQQGTPEAKGFTLHFTDSYFPHVTGRYVLTFSPLRGTLPLDWESYDQWLIPGRKDFLLVQVPVKTPGPSQQAAPPSPTAPNPNPGAPPGSR